MSTQAELPFERFRYWPGQMVRARDFTAQLAEAERFGRWHQRAIHNAFGVRFGFDVTLDTSSRVPRVRIECGVAFDCSGAMLVLQRPRAIAIPPLEPRQSLSLVVLSRDAGGACACGCSHAGVDTSQSASGSSLLEADLAFDWRARQHDDAGHAVLLARVSRGEGDEIVVDATVRVVTRPLARPRVGSGATPGARTPWEPWAAGMQTRIDTSAAGFTQTPSYIASLIATGEPLSFLDTPFFFTHVFDPGPAGFTFRIAAPPIERARVSVESVELIRDNRKRRFPRLRVVATDDGRRSLSALRPGQTVRLVTPTLEVPEHRAPTATIEQVQADKRQLILHLDDPSGVIGELDESLRIVRLDSDGFQLAFPDIARRLGLMVCWFGCQGLEFASPGCPGQRPLSGHCCDDEPSTATSEEASCR
jgi:hypothetical protein